MSRKVLIFRIGSLGDTVVALKAIDQIIADRDDAAFSLLTNLPNRNASKEISSANFLSIFFDFEGVYCFPSLGRSWISWKRLFYQISKNGFSEVVYLMPKRTFVQLVRDYLFFKACGIGTITGIKFETQNPLRLNKMSWESESSRLLRCVNIDALGFSWSQRMLDKFAEKAVNAGNNAKIRAVKPYIAICLGGKISAKNWGRNNWANFLRLLSVSCATKYTLIALGSSDEFGECDRVLESWAGKSLNLCGACDLDQLCQWASSAECFVGHDCGPMHVFALMNTPVVALFSSRALPGQWFPQCEVNRVFYEFVDCFNCGLDTCPHLVSCVQRISPREVVAAVTDIISP